jgi:hypothetical protein
MEENKNKNKTKTVAVRVSTTAGFWPSEELLMEVDKDIPIKEVLAAAAEALNIASTSDYLAKVDQRNLDPNQTFAEEKLSCIVEIEYSKIVKGGGAHPLLTKKEAEKEISKLTSKFLEQRGWEILNHLQPRLKIKFSAPAREDLLVDVNYDDYPSSPPSYIFRNFKDEILTSIPSLPGGFINMSAHPISQSAFICAPGAREYHSHSSHVNDLWDNYRSLSDEYGIVAMLSKIYNFWLSGGKG